VKREQITFLLTGLIAGLISAALGTRWLAILTYGIGPLFFVAVVAGIVITGASRYVQLTFWRYLAGLILSTITYVVALFTFFAVGAFSQNWLHVQPSADILDFGIDIWLGLLAAGAASACGVALCIFLLTGRWSSFLLLRLMLAAFLTIGVTFIANLRFHSYWSFLGVLLPLGSALFCWLVGTQIGQRSNEARKVAPTPATA